MQHKLPILAPPGDAPVRVVVAYHFREAQFEGRREFEVENDMLVGVELCDKVLLDMRVALNLVVQAGRAAADRLLSAAPLATSTDRHAPRCAVTLQDRAQLRGRASGVRCKAMLGGIVEFDYKFTIASIDLLNIALASSILGGVIFGNNISVKVSSPVKSKPESPVKAPFKFITLNPFS